MTDSDDGTETVLFEEMIDENVRFQGYEISIHYKITNYLTVVGGMVFALVAGNLSTNEGLTRPDRRIIGMFFVDLIFVRICFFGFFRTRRSGVYYSAEKIISSVDSVAEIRVLF